MSTQKTASNNKQKEISRIDESRFSKELDALITESEDMRLERMKQHRTRGFVAMNASIFLVMVGVSIFGWFFLMEGNILLALLGLLVSLIPPIFIHIWAGQPIKTYRGDYKRLFMPKLAKILNGLEFHPQRGIRAKVLERLAVIPAHDDYRAEDCFMGTYKGVKVIFSEARLHSKVQPDGAIFDGIFVMLETPQDVFEGHTIITANRKMVKSYKDTRWKTMSEVHVNVTNPDWDKFYVYSTKPESAELVVGERLIKELAEASSVFDNAPLTAVLFGKNKMFIMIPYAHDMFEPSDLFVPVSTKSQAMQCRKEIEQLLEIVDVFDLYQPIKTH